MLLVLKIDQRAGLRAPTNGSRDFILTKTNKVTILRIRVSSTIPYIQNSKRRSTSKVRVNYGPGVRPPEGGTGRCESGQKNGKNRLKSPPGTCRAPQVPIRLGTQFIRSPISYIRSESRTRTYWCKKWRRCALTHIHCKLKLNGLPTPPSLLSHT